MIRRVLAWALLVQTGCTASISELVRTNQLDELTSQCENTRASAVRASCFEQLGNAHFAKAQYAPALRAYERSGIPANDHRVRTSEYHVGLQFARSGEYAKAEQMLARAGYSVQEASLALARTCQELQPNNSCMPRAVAYLERAGRRRDEALVEVAEATFKAAFEREAPQAEELAASYMKEAGKDPAPLVNQLTEVREQRRKRLRQLEEERARLATCEAAREVGRIERIVTAKCEPTYKTWKVKPFERKLVATHKSKVSRGGIVEYTVHYETVDIDNALQASECYYAAYRRYLKLAEALAECQLPAHAAQVRERAVDCDRVRKSVRATRTASSVYPYSVAARFVRPKPDYGPGRLPEFEEETLRNRVSALLLKSEAFQWVDLDAKSSVDFVVEGELEELEASISGLLGLYTASVTARVFDANGKRLFAANRSVTQSPPDGLHHEETAKAVVYGALDEAVENVLGELSLRMNEMSAEIRAQQGVDHKMLRTNALLVMDFAPMPMSSCLDPSGPREVTVLATITFAPSGHVTKVDLAEVAPVVGQPILDCFREALMRLEMLPFSGEPVAFKRTFTLARPSEPAGSDGSPDAGAATGAGEPSAP